MPSSSSSLKVGGKQGERGMHRKMYLPAGKNLLGGEIWDSRGLEGAIPSVEGKKIVIKGCPGQNSDREKRS